MKRICIIGNSHLGALKQAVDGPPIPGVTGRYSFDTFGAIRATLSETRVAEGRLVPTRKHVRQSFKRTGGQEEIDLTCYDGVILAFRNSPYFIRAYTCGANIAPLSHAVVSAVHEAFLRNWSVTLAKAIAEVLGTRPVWFLGRPFNAAHDHHAKRLLGVLNDPDDGAQAQAWIKDICAHVSDTIENTRPASNLFFRRPPEEVLEPFGLFTQSVYSRGGKKLAAQLKSDAHAEGTTGEDTMHMNGSYGAAVLADIFGSHAA